MLRLTVCVSALLSLAVWSYWSAESQLIRRPGIDSPVVTTSGAAAIRRERAFVESSVIAYARPSAETGIALLRPGSVYHVYDEQSGRDVPFMLVGPASGNGPTIGWARRSQLCLWVGGGAIRPSSNLVIYGNFESALLTLSAGAGTKVKDSGEVGHVIAGGGLTLPVLEDRPITLSGRQCRAVKVALVDLERDIDQEQQLPAGALLDVMIVLPSGPDFGKLVSRAGELLTTLETSHDLRVGIVLYGCGFDQPACRVLDKDWRRAIEELRTLPAQRVTRSGAGLEGAVAQAVAARWATGSSRLMVVVSPRPDDVALPAHTLQTHRINVLRLSTSRDDAADKLPPGRAPWLHIDDPAVERAIRVLLDPRSCPHGFEWPVRSESTLSEASLPATGWCVVPEEEFIAIERTLIGRESLDELLTVINVLRAAVGPGATNQDRLRADSDDIWTLPGTLDAILATRSIPTAFNSSLRFTRQELRQWLAAGNHAVHQRLTDLAGRLALTRDRIRWCGSGHEQWGFVPPSALP